MKNRLALFLSALPLLTLLTACGGAMPMKVAESAPRVSLVVKIDYRPGVTDGLTSKLAAVEERLLRD